MKNKSILISALLISTLSACNKIPGDAFTSRGQPESLLSVSSEALTLDLNQRNSLAQLVDIANRENPSSAVLSCTNQRVCERAGDVLEQYGVPYEIKPGGSMNTASLMFERVLARDCENRFITNHINPYNLNHTTFGCSIAVNQVQMVGDKRQFVDPMLLGPYDGFKATQNYDSYLARDTEDRVIQTQRESVVKSGGNN